jgi:DNA-binding response OmpR family regulator
MKKKKLIVISGLPGSGKSTWVKEYVDNAEDGTVLVASADINRLIIGGEDVEFNYIDNEELSLTVREFDILYCMLQYPKKTFTRSKLMEDFWDYDSSATSRTVDVYMAKLRDKTKTCNGFEIQTVHGLGYKVILNEKN